MTATRRIAAALAVVVALSGCAAIPTSGPVTEVPEDSGLGQSTVRYSPAPPTDGAAPGEIVRGYLDAMLAYPASTRTASAFLTPSAAEEWQRQDGVTIYNDAQVATPPEDGRTRSDAGSTAQVTLDAAPTGRLDSQGRFSTAQGREGVKYRLEQVDGQWRIDNPQPGLLVTDKFFADYFRPFELYFFDRTAERLVPQPVHLLVGDGLAAALITALARGDESAQVQSFVPGLEDLRATVPVDGGVADVGFTAGSRSAADVERLSAQVIWTLRQVPDVTSVRISVGSSPVRPNNVAEQPIIGGEEFGAGQAGGSVHALRGNQVVSVDGAAVTPIDGPWGKDAQGAVAMTVGDDRIAVVDQGRGAVQIATLAGAAQRTVKGTDFIDPVTDVDGDVWLVDRPAGSTRVRLVGEGVTAVSAPSLEGLDVRSIDISPEGARYVATIGTGSDASVRVGRVVRDAGGVPTGLATPRRVDGGAQNERSAVWADDIRVSFIAGSTSIAQVQTALIDGSTSADGLDASELRLPEVDTARLAVEGGATGDTYVTDPEGMLWYRGARDTWVSVTGDPVRSLTVHR